MVSAHGRRSPGPWRLLSRRHEHHRQPQASRAGAADGCSVSVRLRAARQHLRGPDRGQHLTGHERRRPVGVDRATASGVRPPHVAAGRHRLPGSERAGGRPVQLDPHGDPRRSVRHPVERRLECPDPVALSRHRGDHIVCNRRTASRRFELGCRHRDRLRSGAELPVQLLRHQGIHARAVATGGELRGDGDPQGHRDQQL